MFDRATIFWPRRGDLENEQARYLPAFLIHRSFKIFRQKDLLICMATPWSFYGELGFYFLCIGVSILILSFLLPQLSFILSPLETVAPGLLATIEESPIHFDIINDRIVFWPVLLWMILVGLNVFAIKGLIELIWKCLERRSLRINTQNGDITFYSEIFKKNLFTMPREKIQSIKIYKDYHQLHRKRIKPLDVFLRDLISGRHNQPSGFYLVLEDDRKSRIGLMFSFPQEPALAFIQALNTLEVYHCEEEFVPLV